MTSFAAIERIENDTDPYFDQLDPCCQREIEDRKKAATLKEQFRQVDRTYERFDAIQKTVDDLRSQAYKSCDHCYGDIQEDYEHLSILRNDNMYCYFVDDNNNNYMNNDRNDDNDNDESDSDSEFDDLLLDYNIVETEYEINMKKNAYEISKKREVLSKLGYETHHEESIEHLVDLIKTQISRWLIIHVYDPNLISCAKIDLYFEKLAIKYPATLFRRIRRNKIMNNTNSEEDIIDILGLNACNNTVPLIGCFVEGQLIQWKSLDDFFEDDYLEESNLTNYLNQSNVINTNVNMTLDWIRSIQNAAILPELINNDDDDHFCDKPGCARNFPHEHVGIGQGLKSLI